MTLIFRPIFFLVFLCCLLSSCDQNAAQPESQQYVNSVSEPLPENSTPAVSPFSNVKGEKRNWQQIKKSGVIRALKLKWEEEDSLPRSGITSLYHIELFEQFANNHDLRIEWLVVNDLKQMFESLQYNRADIIPRHLTVTSNRINNVDFTQPIKFDTEILIAAKDTDKPQTDAAIRISIPKGSSYIETVQKYFPKSEIELLEKALSPDGLADALNDKLNDKKFQYSVLDGAAVNTLLNYRDDIVALTEFLPPEKRAWATNHNNPQLMDKLNEFISAHQITQTSRTKHKLDLNKIKENNLPLRMITRNSPETYFLWRGELMGFEYELMREFAKRHKLRLEVIVAENYQQMKALLEQGQGDLISAGLSRIEDRRSELKFSIRYKRVSELLVAHKDSASIDSLADLKGRSLFVRKTSSFWNTAQQLNKEHGVKVIAADEDLPTELLIAQVADQSIDLTIADSNLLGIEKRFRDNIVTPLTLKENVPYAYAVRDNNPQLLNALNAFIKKEYRGTFYNVIKGKYFASEKRLKRYRQERITTDSELSPYDQQVRKNAREYQFDWRLITAQMFQESRFDPKARSNAGAQGLMQLLPRTANELGYFDLLDPEQSIAAGIEYLDWTRARFENDIPHDERLLFALASYNAGFGHVRDAQKLAKKMNLRSDKWFGNVEKAMLLLQQPKYYKNARFGYCRGSEPVNYVREIQQRYLSYVEITN